MAFRLLPDKNSKWVPVSIVVLGSMVGLGLFLAKEAEIVSYMSDDPKACVNCHVMTSEYNSWMHSSHREVASCNSCHVPQNNVFSAYYFKAKDGLYHSYIFTMRKEPQVIKMLEASQEVVQQNCIHCHQDQLIDPKLASWSDTHKENRTERACWSCHMEVPHGKVHGLSSTKYTIAPIPTDQAKDVVPNWLKEEIKK